MPLGATMIATDVASPFFTPIKLTFWVSLIASAPVILYQVWAFVAPALYKHERKLVIPLLVSSSLLFYIGMAFAYFVVFPLAFGFLTHTAPEGVQVSTDIASYLSFVMALFMAFGVAFEVPVAIVLLCWVGVTTPDDLRKKRPYILVGAFVVGMLLTPPDVFSQTLLAIPMYCLFEVGVFFSRFYVGKGRRADDEDDTSDKTTEELAKTPDVVAIGECGLDFNRNFSTPEEQEKAFTAQLALAAELGMPVFMHCRDAHERFLALLDPWLEKLPGAVLHCFTGSRQEALDCLKRGLYLGITGWVCDERRGLELRELLPVIPADRLLLETDAPYLLPHDMKPKPASRRNEPAYLGHIVERVATWRGEDPRWLSAQTDDNHLLVQQIEQQHRAGFPVRLGKNRLQAFESAFGNHDAIARVRGFGVGDPFRLLINRQLMNDRRRNRCRVGTKTNEVADATRCADSGGVDDFRVELHEQVVREQRLTDGCALPALHFFKRDHGCQAIDRLTFKMFLRALKLPAFAIQ
ncbi:hypothetical protein L1887_45388 [Cichorium endivia]|nr:hypothetical protein L1887_45388 [Cichorium endivia]